MNHLAPQIGRFPSTKAPAGVGRITQPTPHTVQPPPAPKGNPGLLDWLDNADVCSLTLIAIAISLVGKIVSTMRPDPKQWGIKMGVALFLAWAGVWLFENGLNDPNAVFAMLYRGTQFALIVSGIARAVRPVLMNMEEAGERRREAQERIREEHRQAQKEAERQEQERLKALEWERGEPERLRKRIKELEREKNARDEQARREEARAQCELLYVTYEHTIRQLMPREKLSSFMATHMSDEFSASAVERRGQEIRRIMQGHRDSVIPKRPPASIAELTQWYQAEKQSLELLGLEERVKNQQLAMLEERYADLSQRILEKMQP